MNLLYHAGRTVVNTYARTMLNLDIAYHKPMPAGAKIIAANHPTTVDPCLMLTLLPTQTHILISESLFKIPVLGRILRLSGHIPVVVANGRAAFDEAVVLLQRGCTVGIFPEGALSPADGGVYPARTGAVRLALTAHVPVVPVGIHLHAKNITRTRTVIDGVEEHARWYLYGPYAMTVGAALALTGDVEDRDEVRCLSQQLMTCIASLARQSKSRLIQHSHHVNVWDTAEMPGV